jgi:L-amino acid N-acyltransferase YncA
VAEDTEQARASVVARYSRLAREAAAGGEVTDGEGCFGAAAYDDAAGVVPEAALRASLGCGNPVAVAALAPGETVLDLGSGGGLDVLLSARRVGLSGRVYGLDGAPEMIRLARANAAAEGAGNAVFLLGSIEDIPLPDGQVDAVISNCVINLSADKPRVLAEAFRVLRPCGRLLGWVAVSPVSARRVYAGVVEHSVYVDPARHNGGIGSALLAALIASTEAAGIWTVYSSLFPENTASVRLHEKAGFRVVGTRERIACQHGQWRDTVVLERRSTASGGTPWCLSAAARWRAPTEIGKRRRACSGGGQPGGEHSDAAAQFRQRGVEAHGVPGRYRVGN